MDRPPHQPNFKRILNLVLPAFFKLLYHQFAWVYDIVACLVSVGGWDQWVLAVTPYISGPRVLELGFGPGHLQVALRKRNFIVYGLDESHQMTQIAYKRLSHLGYAPNLVRGLADNLPFANRSIDQVVMTFPTETILQRDSLSAIHRVLVQGGNVVILPFAWSTGRTPLQRLAAWINRITGESPLWNEKSLSGLKIDGFESRWEMLDLHSSKILIVHLLKSDIQIEN